MTEVWFLTVVSVWMRALVFLVVCAVALGFPLLEIPLVAVVHSLVAVAQHHSSVVAEAVADVEADKVVVDHMLHIGAVVEAVAVVVVAEGSQDLYSGHWVIVGMSTDWDRYHRTEKNAANCTRKSSDRRPCRPDTRTGTVENWNPRPHICRIGRNLSDHERSLRSGRGCLRTEAEEINWCEEWATD